MKCLCEGFWPFDKGEWKIEVEEITQNYATDAGDIEAIWAFKDKELAAGRWSDPLPDSSLLPGMKVSPLFVIWQNGKPHMNNHSSSGINDGIPCTDAKVKYDNMCTFG
jgi:hypothetical protein